MMAISAYVSMCRSLSEQDFCKHHPHPVLLHEATDPLQPAENTEGETIDMVVRPGPDGNPVVTRRGGSPGPSYTVYVLGPRRGATSSLVSIGGSSRCEIQINDQSISKVHALFEIKGGRSFLSDNGSSTGTWVNNQSVKAQEWIEVVSGDHVSLGRVELTFLPADGFYQLVRRLFID